MLNLRSNQAFIILILLALACIPITHASLSPLSFGFPTMKQFTSNTAFNQAAVNAFDIEKVNISPFGTFGCAFPTIGQTEVQGQVINQCEFAQSTVVSAFSFPAVDTGLGFAGFGDFTGFGDLL
jgi:hypothetical protein